MAVTGQQVFDIAMGLIDEVSETGNLVVENPEYYKTKSLQILTVLQAELLRATQTPQVVTDLSQDLVLSDAQCLKVLPYGLAAHLLIQEDVNTASFYNARYDELKRRSPATIEPITDSYNVLGGMQ